jgi:Tfp pilus assembly protein PilN
MRAVNLITNDERRGPNIPTGRSGGGAYVVLVLLGGLAVFALLYGLADHAISSRRSEVSSLTARAQQAQARAGQLTPYTSFLQMREQRVQTVTQLVDSRFDWAQAFHELGRVLPPGKVSLASLDGTVGSSSSTGASSSSAARGSSVTSATPPGSIPTFALTGCTVSQAEVALMLDRLRLIDGVSEVSLQSSTKSGLSGSGSGGSGSCEGGNVSFSVQVSFDALPAVSTAGGSSSAGTASTASTAAAPASASTTPVSTSSAGAVR